MMVCIVWKVPGWSGSCQIIKNIIETMHGKK